MNWIITLPAIAWSKYKKNFLAVHDGFKVIYFEIPKLPKEMERGDRLFFVWKGKIKGSIRIEYFGRMRRFHCKVTGEHLPEGLYAQVTGKFREIKDKKMRGFVGIRKYVDK